MALDKLKICGHKFKVYYENPKAWTNQGMGRASSVTGEVYINSNMPKDTQNSTLLHEILHLIIDMNDLTVENEETTVSVIANSLYSFIRKNPEFIKSIQS